MQQFGLVKLLLLIVFLWEWEYCNAKPTPGSQTRISIGVPPQHPAVTPVIGPAKLAVPVATPTLPIAYNYNTPILAYNVPLDAATASQRIDIHQSYDYNYIPSMGPLKVIAASPYVESRRFIYASPYGVPLASSAYYAPGYAVPVRYTVPVGLI